MTISRRDLVLRHLYKVGLGNARRLQNLAYAIRLSHFVQNANIDKCENRIYMYQMIRENLKLDEKEIKYLEFGVFEGKSIEYWCRHNRHEGSEFYGFDSFEGLPEQWFPGMEAGSFDVGGRIPALDDNRVRFIKGWFNESLPEFLKETLSFEGAATILHLDADLYSSTYYVLNCLYFHGIIKAGTVLIFDEAIVASIADTEFRAWYDFVEAIKLKYRVIAIGHFEMAVQIL